MKRKTKNALIVPSVLGSFFTIAFTWYMLIMRPQIKVAKAFLESLRTRNAKLLQETVVPEEYETYKRLYLRSGFNKHLISFSKLQERDSNNHFFPSYSRYSVEVEEDDVFFGRRKLEYFISLSKRGDKWGVMQFSSRQDYDDLLQLRDFAPPAAKRK